MRVIIVEDETAVADLYERLLEPVSSRIQRARDISELREALKSVPPTDVVILDLKLGEDPITETIHEIPKIKAVNPHAVVVVASGNTNPEIIKEVMREGADYFAIKPETNSTEGMIKAVLAGIQGKPRTARVIELIEKLTGEMQSPSAHI